MAEGFSSRRSRLALAIAVAGLALYAIGLRYQWTGAMLPPAFDAKALAYPVRVDGHDVGSAAELDRAARRHASGESLVVGAGAGAASVTLVRECTVGTFLATMLASLLWWAVAAFVFAPRIDWPGARSFFAILFLGGLSLANGDGYPPGLGEVPTLTDIACLAFMPALFLHSSMAFPRPVASTGWVARVLLGVAVAVAASRAVTWFLYERAPTSARWTAVDLADTVWRALLVAQVAAGIAFLFRSRHRAEIDRERRQARWLLWGLVIGAFPYVFLRTLPKALGAEPPADVWLDRVFQTAIPISFAVAVVRYRFLDIDVIVRRGTIYTLLAALLAVANLLLLLWVGPALRVDAEVVSLVAVGVSVALFGPARRAVGAWVDRAFFHIARDRARALDALRADLHVATSQRDVASVLDRFLERSLAPETAFSVVRSGDGFVAGGGAPASALPLAAALFERFAGASRGGGPGGDGAEPLARPQATGRPEIETGRFPSALEAAGVALVQPAATDGRCMAVLCLGPKRSQRRYVDEELDLLATAAASAAEAVGRLDLVQRVAAEEAARKALADLDRAKSEFLLRVAHDLRTPLTAIDWSTRNLKDGLAGPLSPDQARYLESVQAACRALSRRVADLLEISRIETGAPRAPLAPVDLPAVARESVAGILPLAAAKDVRVEVGAEAGLPPVRADRDKAFAVLQNLLDNALKYAPPGSAIDVAVGRAEGGGVRLVVRDRGPGIDEAQRDRLFERFGQGTPSPFSGAKGYGLGLHIVKTYVDLFGGRVGAENHPEGGARFVVVLHAWDDPGDGAA